MTEKEEIKAILDLFTTDGMRFMLEDISKHYDGINNIDSVSTTEDLHFIKGQRHSLRWMLGMKDWYQNALDNLEAQDADI
jgi:hypothetical protein